MAVDFRETGPGDEAMVLELMREFYGIERLPYDPAVASRALGELWGNPAYGRVCLIEVDGSVAGYAVLTFGFSLEFRGRDALIDELYVREPHRGVGVGTACLAWVDAVCIAEGIHAVHLQVDHANLAAQRLYDRSGYRRHDRHFLTKWLLP